MYSSAASWRISKPIKTFVSKDCRIYRSSCFHLFQYFYQSASDATCPMRPVRIDGDTLQAWQQQTDQFIIRFRGFHKDQGAPGVGRTHSHQIRRLMVGELICIFVSIQYYYKQKERGFSPLFLDYNYGLLAPIAQLDRASVFGTGGWEFEPLWAHILLPAPRPLSFAVDRGGS